MNLVERMIIRDFSLDTIEQIIETSSKDSLLYKFTDAYIRVCLDSSNSWLKVKHLQNVYHDKEMNIDG